MQLLSEKGGLSPIGVADKVAPGRPSGAMAGLKGPGFKAIMAGQGLAQGERPASPKGQSLPLSARGDLTAGGEMLPPRSGAVSDSMAPAQAAVAELTRQLDDLTDTVGQLLEHEHDGEGSLSTWLSQQLGLDEDQVDAVIEALENWVAQPPEAAVDVGQVLAAGPDGLAEVTAITDLLAGLEEELAGWLNALGAPQAGGPENPSTVVPGDPVNANAPAGASPVDGLARLMGSEPAADRAATLIARILQNIQNSSSSGSLPVTMDLSRPEAELLVAQDNQPAEKTAFNAALIAMARQSLGGLAATAGESADLPAALTGLEAAAGTAPGAESVLKTSDPLALQRLERPLLAAEAGRQLGERIHMMVRGEIQHATIRLDPPELGALDIRVTVQNDQTQVQIVVQSNQVREALESQSARLREFLEQQGLSLENLDIRDGSAQGREEGDTEQRAQGSGDDSDDGEAVSDEPRQPWRPGLVDYFV